MMTVIKNITAASGEYKGKIVDCVIDGKTIKALAPNAAKTAPEGAREFDGTGLYLLPGLIDAHCHLRDPGYEYKEDIASGTLAAAAGGFCRVACMPNTKPVADNAAVIAYIKEKAAKCGSVKVLPIGAISKGEEGAELAEMGDMKEAGAVAVSDDGRPVASAGLMKKAMQYASYFGLPVISHCEEMSLVEGGSMNEGLVSTKLGLRGIPAAAEEVMVAREIILAEYLHLPVHIAHISTRVSTALVRDAKARGVAVTAETCPHYFSLNEGALMSFDTNAKVNPPLRTAADVAAITEGLRDGTIDIIATDHAPHHIDEKRVEFEFAANGISGFETAFSLAYTNLVKTKKITLETLVEKMSDAPARLFGITDMGLAAGKTADLTLVDITRERVVDANKFFSKGKNTPFAGMTLTGVVAATVVDGKFKFVAEENK